MTPEKESWGREYLMMLARISKYFLTLIFPFPIRYFSP